MTCKKCGFEYDDRLSACPKCGRKSKGLRIISRRKFFKKLLTFILVLCIVALAVFILVEKHNEKTYLEKYNELSSAAEMTSENVDEEEPTSEEPTENITVGGTTSPETEYSDTTEENTGIPVAQPTEGTDTGTARNVPQSDALAADSPVITASE